MKQLFTCRAGISLLDMGVKFSAWDETVYEEGEGPTDSDYIIYVPESDLIALEDEGCYDVVRFDRVEFSGEMNF